MVLVRKWEGEVPAEPKRLNSEETSPSLTLKLITLIYYTLPVGIIARHRLISRLPPNQRIATTAAQGTTNTAKEKIQAASVVTSEQE